MFLLSPSISKNSTNPTHIQPLLNIINGASTECVMHHFYIHSGWTQIEGEIGRNGIDGLYYKKKNNIIKEVLVAESKWNTSRLGFSGKNKTVKQMSQEWVLRTMDKLVKKMDTETYRTLRKLISHDQYRARLFRLKPVGDNSIQITIYKIKNKGIKAFNEIRDTQLRPIDINTPVNSFEKGIVKAYNNCRKKYLYKYLDTLSDEQIDTLLKGNYIQRTDVKNLFHNYHRTKKAKIKQERYILRDE